MNSIVRLLFEGSIGLLLFYLVYYLGLRKETFFKANRFYLLGAALLSIALPLIQIPLRPGNTQPTVFYNVLDTVTVQAGAYEQSLISKISELPWIAIVYFSGVFLSLLLLGIKFLKIRKLLSLSTPVNELTNGRVRFIQADVVPFSFMNRIYINPEQFGRDELNRIIAHEQVHIAQYHTLDCLFYELLIAFFWFNPIVYQYRISAKELHEFLADEGAIQSGIEQVGYHQLLFEQATGLKTCALGNSFNYSLLKRRLIMLTKIKSSKLARIRLLFALPFMLLLVVVFACNKPDSTEQKKSDQTEIQEKSAPVATGESTSSKTVEGHDDLYFKADKMPEFEGGEFAFRNFLASNLKYPSDAKEDGKSGKVYVSFTVDKNGKVKDVKVRKSVYPSLDTEAVRVISMLPDWTPGEDHGEKVDVQFTVPINFALQ